MSKAEAELVDLAKRAGDAIGQRFLDATDVDDLEGALEECLENRSLWAALGEVTEQLGRLPRSEMIARLSEPSAVTWDPTLVAKVFGEQGIKALDEADQLGIELGAEFAELLPLGAFVEAARQVGRISDPLGFLTDRSVPSPVAQLLLEVMKLNPLTFAVLHALLKEERLAPWLSHALLSRWVRAIRVVRQFIRLVALTAPGKKHDPETMQWAAEVGAFQARVNAGYAELLRRGRESGVDIFPPE